MGNNVTHFVRTSGYVPGSSPRVLQYSRLEIIPGRGDFEHSEAHGVRFDWLSHTFPESGIVPVTFVHYGLNTSNYTGEKLSASEIQLIWEQAETVFGKGVQEKEIYDWMLDGKDNGRQIIERGRLRDMVVELEYQQEPHSLRLRALGPKEQNPTGLIGTLNLNSIGGKIYHNPDARQIVGADYCWQEGYANLPLEGRTMDEILKSARVKL
jgi:hypothetical protein